MASSSSQRGKAKTTSPPFQPSPPPPPPVESAVAGRAPPPPDQLAAFYALVNQRENAASLCRHAHDAELSGRAAAHAEALFGEDSLVVASLRWNEARPLCNVSSQAVGVEKEALLRRAWALLLPLHALVLRRVASNSLLPDTLHQEEIGYGAHLASCPANKTLHAVHEGDGQLVGYSLLCLATSGTLNMMPVLQWPPAQAASAQSFVLDALDVIPRTNGDVRVVDAETYLVAYVDDMHQRPFDPAFRDAVLCKWRSPAVSAVLRSRGVLQIGLAHREKASAEYAARRRVDIEEIGLRECALPSCDKVERTVREFKQCSGCRSVWYCSAEHQMLDWGVHRKACGTLDAARRKAAEEATKRGAGGARAQ